MTDDLQALVPLPRLTTSVRQQLLDQNEGLTFSTSYRDRNSHEDRTYLVKGGELLIRAIGKGAFGGSQYDSEWVADADEVHRALYNHQRQFDHSNVDPSLKLPKPQPVAVTIPEEIVDGLADDASPEAQSRVAAWFEELSPAEKLVFGGIVITIAVGSVIVYRFRRPIGEKMRSAAAAVRRKFDRRALDAAQSDERTSE